MQGQCLESDTLWQVLEKIGNTNMADLIGRQQGDDIYLRPAVTILRQDFTELNQLAKTTLRSLGYHSGSLMMHLRLIESPGTAKQARAFVQRLQEDQLNKKQVFNLVLLLIY